MATGAYSMATGAYWVTSNNSIAPFFATLISIVNFLFFFEAPREERGWQSLAFNNAASTLDSGYIGEFVS